MKGPATDNDPDIRALILAHLDAMDELLTILDAHTVPGPIGRITLALWSWHLLWQYDVDIRAVGFGDSAPDEDGRVRSLDGWYVGTRNAMVMVSVDHLQSTAYRLWDRKDRELLRDRRGWFYIISGRT